MHQQLQIELGQYSHAGIKPQNEDAHGVLLPDDSQLEKKGICIAIADGMSGSDGAKEASQLAIKMFLNDYYSTPDSWSVKQAVLKVMTALNNWLYSQGQQRYDSPKGLVTTFSAIVLKSCTAHLFHVGDSRIYRLRKQELKQLTRDHRVMLSAAKTYLSRAIGIDLHLDIDYSSQILNVDDVFILTTDGVHDFISNDKLMDLIQHNTDPQQAAEAIVKYAKQQQSDDNLTTQVIKISALAQVNKNEFFQELTELPFPPELSTGNIIDHYQIIRELNATSRSQVYLAKDTQDASRKVVLKTPSINFEDDPTYIELFLHEEWVGKRLNSPHIIKVCNEHRPKTFLYTVVEYIEGQTLKQWMQDNPNPSVTQVRNSIDQIARGLRAMHRLEMVHQDLKPDNILIDNNNTLKIIDLASTKIAGLAEIASALEHGHIAGTANYSAPEYFAGGSGSNQSDIYSLGVIAYEMFTAKLPYGEISLNQSGKRKYRYRSIREFDTTVPEWIDKAIEKAVNPIPEYRYLLLSEFIVDLSKPNQQLLKKDYTPLLERNPLRFWQIIALLEFILLILVLYSFS